MENLNIARKMLVKHNKNLVVTNNNEILFQSEKRGILPIYDLYNSNMDGDIYIADKFIGGGATKILLNLSANICGLHAQVISSKALIELENKGIMVAYDKIVDKILNRKGDDLCPIEKLSLEYEDFNDFFIQLKKFLLATKQIRGWHEIRYVWIYRISSRLYKL